LSYEATVSSVLCPDRSGVLDEVILCANFQDLLSPDSQKPKYVGTIGRVSNRIGRGKFSINDVQYSLATNNGENHLHGGSRGFDKVVWSWCPVKEDQRAGVRFRYHSYHMEEGYPGEVDVCAEYCITPDNEMTMTFTAVPSQSTPISITNHAMWNLSGGFTSDIKNHTLELSCTHYLPVDDGLIPTGEVAAVEGTVFDMRSAVKLETIIAAIGHCGINGVDHSFVVSAHDVDEILPHVATLTCSSSGRQLVVNSNQPAVQIYTGNFLSSNLADAPFCQHYGVCIENQAYPDAVNKPHFPTMIVNEGETYTHHAVYKFRTV